MGIRSSKSTVRIGGKLPGMLVQKPLPGTGAIPTYVAAGTKVGLAAAAGITLLPAGYMADDLGLLFVETISEEAATLSDAQGWALLNEAHSPGATTVGTRLTVFWKRFASDSETAPTLANPGNHTVSTIAAFRGVKNGSANNFYNGTPAFGNAVASTSMSIAGITTTVNNCLMLYACTSTFDTVSAQFSAQANASLASITERFDNFSTAGNGGGTMLATGTLATAGASGTMTGTLANSSEMAFCCIALEPQPY